MVVQNLEKRIIELIELNQLNHVQWSEPFKITVRRIPGRHEFGFKLQLYDCPDQVKSESTQIDVSHLDVRKILCPIGRFPIRRIPIRCFPFGHFPIGRFPYIYIDFLCNFPFRCFTFEAKHVYCRPNINNQAYRVFRLAFTSITWYKST
jgi:hypothetical protein